MIIWLICVQFINNDNIIERKYVFMGFVCFRCLVSFIHLHLKVDNLPELLFWWEEGGGKMKEIFQNKSHLNMLPCLGKQCN